eukprot:6461832-Amphidinium_carterae.1
MTLEVSPCMRVAIYRGGGKLVSHVAPFVLACQVQVVLTTLVFSCLPWCAPAALVETCLPPFTVGLCNCTWAGSTLERLQRMVSAALACTGRVP